MMEPFANQTFRCPRCGGPGGPSCRCFEQDLYKKNEFKYEPPVIPKYNPPPLIKPIEPLMKEKKPWEY